MSATSELFARWKAHRGIQSDRGAAETLGVSHGAPHHWKNGRNAAPAVIEKMAKDLGEDPTVTILQAFAEAATDAADKRTLGRLARSLGAAVLALVVLPYVMTHSAAAQGLPGESARQHPIHYAKWLRERFRRVGVRFAALLESPRWNRPALSHAKN